MQNEVKAISAQVKDGQLEVLFSTGMRSLWPISSFQFAKRVDGVLTNFRPSEEELTEVDVWPSGEIIEFPRCDQAFQVSALMQSEVGNTEWMEHSSEKALATTARRIRPY